jgi:N-terminal domain of oxidoreductase
VIVGKLDGKVAVITGDQAVWRWPDLSAGQVLIRPIVFSVDPTLRGRLTGVDNYYAPQVRLGAPIDGWAVGEVVESRLETVHPGDRVTGSMEWAELATAARAQVPIAACPTPDQVPALAIGTPMPGSIWAGPLAEGRTSMSKISVGMYTVEHEFGISTTPDSLPSIGAEPKIM